MCDCMGEQKSQSLHNTRRVVTDNQWLRSFFRSEPHSRLYNSSHVVIPKYIYVHIITGLSELWDTGARVCLYMCVCVHAHMRVCNNSGYKRGHEMGWAYTRIWKGRWRDKMI